MAVNNLRSQVAYGLSDSLINVFGAPIVSQRAPTANDTAPLGTLWVNKATNAAWILTSTVANVSTWADIAGGGGMFNTLVVQGNITSVAGNITATAGNVVAGLTVSGLAGVFGVGGILVMPGGNITTDDGNVLIGNTAAAGTPSELEFNKSRTGGVITSGDSLGLIAFNGVATDGNLYEGAYIISTTSGTIGVNRIPSDLEFWTHPDAVAALPTQRMIIGTTGLVTINAPDSGSAALEVLSGIEVTVTPATNASPTNTATINARFGQAIFTGFTTAAAASQAFVITNNVVASAASTVLVTVCNSQVTNNALMTLTAVVTAVHTLTVTVTNNGTQALDGNIYINFWVMD